MMRKNETIGRFLLGLMVLDKVRREKTEDFFTIIQAALMGEETQYDAAALLAFVLPPGRDAMYNGGYCPPCDMGMIALLSKIFEFSLAEAQSADYNSVKIVRKFDKKSVIITMKVGFDFDTSEYQKELEKRKFELERKEKFKLASLYKRNWKNNGDRIVAEYLGIDVKNNHKNSENIEL